MSPIALSSLTRFLGLRGHYYTTVQRYIEARILRDEARGPGWRAASLVPVIFFAGKDDLMYWSWGVLDQTRSKTATERTIKTTAWATACQTRRLLFLFEVVKE